MEEILNKINELEQFSDKRNELNDKQTYIKGKQEELKKLQEKRNMNISPITAPVLDEQIQKLESEIERLNTDYKEENETAREEFESTREELRRLVERQKSLYKRRNSINQERVKGLEEVAKGREKAEEEFSERNGEIIEEIAQAWSKRKIYQQILDDAKATHENMVKAFSEGKTVDQAEVRRVLDEISANEKKIKDIDSSITGMQQDFENSKQSRIAELDDYEDRVNHYKIVEDNMEEIDDLEHLAMSINGFTFDNIDALKNNPVIASLRQRTQKTHSEQKHRGKPNDDIDSKISDNNQGFGNKETESETKGDTQYDLDKRRALDSLDKTDIGINYEDAQNLIAGNREEQEKSEDIRNLTPKDLGKSDDVSVRGITIKDGIIVNLEKAGEISEVEIDFKHVKKNYKMTEDEKFEILSKMIDDDEYFINFDIDAIIERADPNVILGLKEASKYVFSKEIGEKARAYLEALGGNDTAREKMKDFVTYDMRKRTGLSRLNFVSRIRNYRYFRTMKRYVENAKDFVIVLKDKRSKRIKGASKNVPLLGQGLENAKEFVGRKIEDAKGSEIKDALDDTAARARLKVSAFKKGYQVYQQEYQDKKTKLENEGVPQIPTGPDIRTQGEKEEDTALKNGADER